MHVYDYDFVRALIRPVQHHRFHRFRGDVKRCRLADTTGSLVHTGVHMRTKAKGKKKIKITCA